MPVIIVLIRIALSAVFAVAGVTKVLDPRGTREAMKNFRSPEALAPVLSFVLPIAELAIAVGLLVDRTTGVSALAALLVLGLFIVAISVNLARGRTHDCHCFGQLYSRPLGWSTLMRNLIFALAAVIVLRHAYTRPVLSVPGTLANLGSFQWLLMIGTLVMIVVTLMYLKRQKRLPAKTSAALKGLPLHSIAPPFELSSYAGGKSSLEQLLAYGKPLLLIFTNPTCGPCVLLFKEIKE
jgi:uncharacterized membrane protein YphA (DoxX/SURF4 family)